MNKAMMIFFIVLALFMSDPANISYSIEPEEQKNASEQLDIQTVEHSTGEGFTEIIIKANIPFEYTSYDPEPGILIIEIPEGDVRNLPRTMEINTPEIKSLTIKTIDGTRGEFFIGRFEVQYLPEAQHIISMIGSHLHIKIERETKVPKIEGETKISSETVDRRMKKESPLPEATQIYGIRVDDSHPHYLDITLVGDGKLTYHDFTIENPDRIVLDFERVSMNLANKSYDVHNPYVARVRTGQFQIKPEKIGRVVFDMKQLCPYEISSQDNSLTIRFGREEETLIAKIPKKEAVPHQVAKPLGPPSIASSQNIPQEKPTPEILAQEKLSLPEEEKSLKIVAPVGKKRAPEVLAGSEEAPPQEIPKIGQESLPREEAAISHPSRYTKADFEKIIAKKAKEDYVIFKEEPKTFAAPQEEEEKSLLDFERKTITREEVKYTGKKISLNLVDADIKQVFRLFHEISGLNFVLDPSVGGKVTIVLDNVPWDQALDIILKNNGLDKVFENNVIRIAPTQKLAQEAAQRKQLKEAKELEVDPITITRTLSYAKALEIEKIIRQSGMISPRGRVIMDERTNSLIVTDVPTRIPPIDNLITTLDTETPQVMIEARIVETSRQFIQDFGIDWGFTGTADPNLGTQTNLQFPHSATVDYDLRLPFTPPNELSPNELTLSFGNVLKSFTLDITLEALEVEGKARILSAPKIATQNNEKAVIERGVQIPIVNTTATEINIQFVSASLKLQVTPQITAEETIILDITVENNSPDFVNRVGDIPPINTQRAQTKVLIEDGGTTVIGGIFSQSEGLSELGVPWFRKIPLFGWLFKSRNISNENRELLIFLTPKIMRSSI